MRNNGRDYKWKRWILESLSIVMLYAGTGQLGFLLAISPGNVTAVWAPSGIAFAAVIIFGFRACLPIWLGSFLVNTWFYTHFTVFSLTGLTMPIVIATGSMLQAALGGYLLRKIIGSRAPVDRPLDAFKYVGVSAISCIVAATFGVTALWSSGLVSWERYAYTWLTWWAGDLAGVLVVTSFALTWRQIPAIVKDRRRFIELLVLLGVLFAASQEFAFGNWSTLGRGHYPSTFLFFPFLMWAAARFGASGVTLTVLVIEMLALWGTKNGFGPFARGTLNDSLMLLQAFIGMVALSGLSLASVLTEWQHSRQDLEEFAQQLEAKIVERTGDLEESNRNLQLARDQAIESSNLKSAFIATISHELRTPLNGIIGATQLLASEDVVDNRKELLTILQDSAQSLLILVNGILDLAKLEAGKMAFENEPFNLIYLVQDSARLMALEANSKGIILRTSIDHRIPELVRGDHARVRQILLNLIGNAIKFTDVGEVCIDAALHGEDDTSVSIRFNIRDTGIGISEHEKRLLFKPFTQIDSSDTRKYAGTGLGLSICKQLTEAMGGRIDAESVKDQGSLFWFLLPFGLCIDPSSKCAVPSSESKSDISGLVGKIVLVVEDNRVIRTLVAKQLASLGIRTKEACNGQEAVEAVTAQKYDLILMDCQMPDVDGFQATRRIRQLENGTGVHSLIVALTAGAMQGDEAKCRAAGMDDYLSKPININDLATTLRRWLTKNGVSR